MHDSLSWSPDSTKLALGAWDNTVTIWDVANGTLVSTLQHASDVTSVAWSPDGNWIASSSMDRTVRIWDAAMGKEVSHRVLILVYHLLLRALMLTWEVGR